MSSMLAELEDREYYTYADYLKWDTDARIELINGITYMMSPPLTIHQRIARRLYVKLASFLDGKPCEAFIAPFGVRLFPREDHCDDTIVEPDIVVVCDPSKIDEQGCNGAPDLVIEVLSPSNHRLERLIKFDLYLKAKVREYWVVSPEGKEIEVHIYDRGRYFTKVYGFNEPGAKEDELAAELIPVSVLPGLAIDVKDIF